MPASTAGPDKPRPAPQVLPDQVAPLDDAMRLHIQAALSAAKGRIEGPFGAANRLKINPHTLRARMRKLGIDWKRFRQKSTSPNTGSQP
jgi:transcriptional regulator with GAF, ATPase, and Fis domain